MVDNRTLILSAINANDLDQVKVLVNEIKTPLNQVGSGGSFLLSFACAAGRTQIAHYFIVHCKVDIEKAVAVSVYTKGCPSIEGKITLNPLQLACGQGQLEVVKLLLQHGANPNAVNEKGHTCLMMACVKREKGAKVVEELLKAGANIHSKDHLGDTVLHKAVYENNLEVVCLLVEKGADVLCPNDKGLSCVLSAAFLRFEDVMTYLCSLPQCPAEEMIKAFKFIGAFYLDIHDSNSVIKHWKIAVDLEGFDGPSADSKEHPGLGTIHSLQAITSGANSTEQMYLKSLEIKEEIFGASKSYSYVAILNKAVQFHGIGNINGAIRGYMYVHSLLHSCISEADLEHLLKVYTRLYDIFIYCFMVNVQFADEGKVQQVIHLFDSAIELMKCKMEDRTISLVVYYLTFLVFIKFHRPQEVPENFDASVKRLVVVNPKMQGKKSLLHVACAAQPPAGFESAKKPLFPCPAVVKVLLKAGAFPGAVDENGNTPLHLIAKQQHINYDIVKTLLENGAHFDQANSEKDTLATLVGYAELRRAINLNAYLSLKCLAATAIQQHKIPFHSLEISCRLKQFIELH